MIPSQPIIHEGKTYPEYHVSLCCAPIIRGSDYATGVNLVLTPMRLNEDVDPPEIELLQTPEHVQVVRYSDIRKEAGNDMVVLTAFGTIDAIIQGFINDKGL